MRPQRALRPTAPPPPPLLLLLLLLLLLFAVVAATRVAVAGPAPVPSAGNFTLTAKFALTHPSFIRVFDVPTAPGSSETAPTLFITSFSASPLTPPAVFRVDGLGAQPFAPRSHALPASSARGGLKWPNDVSFVPAGLLPDPARRYLNGTVGALLVPDGFLVPLFDHGGVFLLPLDETLPLLRLTPDAVTARAGAAGTAASVPPYFYHIAFWVDLNLDGCPDVLTARATAPLIGARHGQLVWLECPAAYSSAPLEHAPWAEHVLVDGPDFEFAVRGDVDDATRVVRLARGQAALDVVAAQFFGDALVAYEIALGPQPKVTRQRALSAALGAVAFEGVAFVDWLGAGDASRGLLVNTHLGGAGGAVYAVSLPAGDALYDESAPVDFVTLADNFTVVEHGIGQAAPGFSFARFVPSADTAVPYVFVAGDGSQSAYILRPRVPRVANVTELAYDTLPLGDLAGMVGSLAMRPLPCATADVGASCFALLAPSYDVDTVFRYDMPL